MRTEAYTTHSSRKTLITAVILLSVGILSLTFSRDNAQTGLQYGALTVLGSFQRGAAGIGQFFSGTVTSIRELGELREQYDLLAARLNEMEENVSDIEELYIENLRLKEAMEFSSNTSMLNIPAQIIAKDPGNFFATITVNKGSVHGVRQGDPVIAIQDGNKGLVGRVILVANRTSMVQPMFDSRSHVASRLQSSRYEGLVSGTGRIDRLLEMQFVPQRAFSDIHKGDLIITSGMSQAYPPGIQIGTVNEVSIIPYETSLSITLESIIDFSRIELVYILTKDVSVEIDSEEENG
ncbi:rod shape-determining protein MreC [Spirochaeta dissipatitropha]